VVSYGNAAMAASLAQAMIASGEQEAADRVLASAEAWTRTRQRWAICQLTNCTLVLARILGVQGKRNEALVELRSAIDAGDGYDWQLWSRDPAFAAIADTPEFKQCVEIVKARNAQQLASLRARPELPKE
jgi:hypothetical protein